MELTSVRVPARDIAILTVAETAKLLKAAEEYSSLLPYVALGLFAGLRPGEAQQIRWSDIHFEAEQIEIRPETTKVRQRRFVPLEAHCVRGNLVSFRTRALEFTNAPRHSRIV